MFDDRDRAQLKELGISEEEVARQVQLFREPPPRIVLDRPCTLDDGIAVLSDAERQAALQAWAQAARDGRLLKFVPASGAATRMFQSLLVVRQADGAPSRSAVERRAAAGDKDAKAVLAFADNLRRFAFRERLAQALTRRGGDLADAERRGDIGAIIDALLERDGLDYAALPKALILFHRYPDGSRTSFEEHHREGAAYGRAEAGLVRMHFTVSPEHADACRAELDAFRARCEAQADARLEIGFSYQSRATDTVAVDLDDQPLRDERGALVFRPGGHGALIENLNQLDGDIIFLKTIDNIQPDQRRAPSVEWLRILSGHLVRVQGEVADHLRVLTSGAATAAQTDAARRFATTILGLMLPENLSAQALARALNRPVRVCGMVVNSGEPGGGPFWVRGADGTCTRQIVESAQVDMDEPKQRAAFNASTHFNPVLIACGVRDWHGRKFDLREFVDPSAVFIARKSKDGRELKALERPGLWNGGMARWHTLFVEIPDTTFAPVKTVNDLLRPEHQTADVAEH